MINTPPGDAAEDEVGAAGSGSVGTQGEVGRGWGGGGGSERSGAERAESRTHCQLGEKEARQGQSGPPQELGTLPPFGACEVAVFITSNL